MIELDAETALWVRQHFGDRPWSVSGLRLLQPHDFEEMPENVISGILAAAREELQGDHLKRGRNGYDLRFDENPTVKSAFLAHLLELILQGGVRIYFQRKDGHIFLYSEVFRF